MDPRGFNDRDAVEELRAWFSFGKVWLLLGGVAVLLTTTGAFDLDMLDDMAVRATLVGVMTLGGGIGCAFTSAAIRALTGRSPYRDFRLTVSIGIVATLLGGLAGRAWHAHELGYDPSLTDFSRTIVHASFVVLVMLMFMYVLHFRHLSAKADDFASAEAVDTPPSTPSYMESEDHYLKCVNDGGVEVVRASLTEFAGKFGNLGFRCHKSFWVAQHAVDHKRRDGRRLLLVLKDGTEIPVGRSYEKSVLSRLSVAGIFGARKAYGSAE